jgi:Tripartite tricarboxylate transporter TctB family
MIYLLRSKDFLGGALLMALGLAAIVIARHYAFGTASQMGPGFLPVTLGLILMVLGAILVLKARSSTDNLSGLGGLRPVIVVLSAVLIFALALDRIGFVLSSLLLVMVSCAAQSPFKPVEAVAVALALTAGVVALFVYALGIPFTLWPS